MPEMIGVFVGVEVGPGGGACKTAAPPKLWRRSIEEVDQETFPATSTFPRKMSSNERVAIPPVAPPGMITKLSTETPGAARKAMGAGEAVFHVPGTSPVS